MPHKQQFPLNPVKTLVRAVLLAQILPGALVVQGAVKSQKTSLIYRVGGRHSIGVWSGVGVGDLLPKWQLQMAHYDSKGPIFPKGK